MVFEEPEFAVARVEASGGPAGAGAAFDRLEANMDSFRGRKMYGVLYPGSPDRYFACLRLDDQASDDYGFERATVPGGMYGRSLVREWGAKVGQLPRLFDELHEALVGAGHQIDRTRPLVEYYRRHDALTIMIPVVGTDGVGG